MFSSHLLNKYCLSKTFSKNLKLPKFYKNTISVHDHDQNPKLKVFITYTDERNNNIAESICYPETGQIGSLKIFDGEHRGKGLGKEILKDTISEMQEQNRDLDKVWTICANKDFWGNVFGKSFKIKNPVHETTEKQGHCMSIETERSKYEKKCKKECLQGKICIGVLIAMAIPFVVLHVTFVTIPIWIKNVLTKSEK